MTRKRELVKVDINYAQKAISLQVKLISFMVTSRDR